MKYATTDRLSDVELVATILGRQSQDEAVTRLATVLAVDGWMVERPLPRSHASTAPSAPRALPSSKPQSNSVAGLWPLVLLARPTRSRLPRMWLP